MQSNETETDSACTDDHKRNTPLQVESAEVGRRITAAFIDLCVVSFLFFMLGYIGSLNRMRWIQYTYLFWIVPVIYALCRDMYMNGKPMSLGKRAAKLGVVNGKGKNPDFVDSIQRNILFCFPPLSLCMAGLELYLLVRSKNNKRFGDHFGNTTVTQEND